MQKNFLDPNWKKYIPIPVSDEYCDFNELYDKAWELAHDHIRSIEGMPQTPYMDEAFCDTQIWIWDTCFMSQFCKYAQNVFPGIESFKNFYEVLYDGHSLPSVVPTENEPSWTGAKPNIPFRIEIHLLDNPPLFAWAEYENALFSGDLEHLRELLYEKKYLQKHFEWFETRKAPEKPEGIHAPTYLIAEDIGYRWEGGRSGMDNTPRGRDRIQNGKERPRNPDMLWVDALAQQALTAKTLSELFTLFDDKSEAEAWSKIYEEKKALTNKYYWDDEDKFYYDIDVNTHAFYKVQTPASYWPLLAKLSSPEQARALCDLLHDPDTFGGDVPLISLARNDGDFYPDGRYWRGGLWLPTSYMALKGLSEYGFHKETHDAAVKIVKHMLATYKNVEPHTIWECYSPTEPAPSVNPTNTKTVRTDFCGWSALGPISMYIEFILGFSKVDAFKKTVEWEKPENASGKIGIKNFRFGDIVTDIIADGNDVNVVSNGDYTLVINGKNYEIKNGTNNFVI